MEIGTFIYVNWLYLLIAVIVLVTLIFLFKDKIRRSFRWIWKKIKVVFNSFLRGVEWLVKVIIKVFLDIGAHINHFIFVIIMFLIAMFSFFIFLILKDVWTNNFSDPQWTSLKILFLVVSLLLISFLGILMASKYQNFVTQYILFPALIFIWLYIKTNKGLADSLFSFLIIATMIIHYYLLRKVWKEPNKRVLLTVFLITLLLAFGFTFVDSFTGERRMDFGLNNCYNNNVHVGEIKCTDALNHVVVGHKVACSLKVDNNLAIPDDGFVKFTFLNGESRVINLSKSDSYSFIVPDKVGSIYFEFKNNESCLSVGYPRTYPEYAEFKEDKINFMYMILALLGFCLISVPIIIKNFSEL